MISGWCKPGYFGRLCNVPCPYGTYGPRCGGFCRPFCSYEECDHVYGCPKNTETTTERLSGIKYTKYVFQNFVNNKIWFCKYSSIFSI